MSFTIPSIFTAIDKMSAPLRKMTANVQSFAKKSEIGIARLDRGLRRLTPSLGSMGKQLLAFASATALIAGIGASINKVNDFEQATANLSSVMGVTVVQNKLLIDDSKRLGAVTAKSATQVTGLQESFARLGFVQGQILNMTEATINGSIAMNSELAETAELTGAMVNTFKKFSSIDTPEIIDKMTFATQKSALTFEKLQTSLPIVAKAADESNVPFSRLLAMLGKLSDGGLDASSSATALRNIFLESAKRGVSYEVLLEKVAKSTNKLNSANVLFGKRGAIAGSILAASIEPLNKLTTVLDSAAAGQINAGIAAKTARTQLDTLQGSLTLLSSAWEGLLIKTNDNTGSLGLFRTVIDFVTKNLETIAGTALKLIGVFLALKTIIFLSRTALLLYNVGLGITSALSGTAAVAVGANSAALSAYTAVQWLANAALLGFPLTWVVVAIAAVVAAVASLIIFWEELVNWITTSNGWFAKLIRFALLPLIITFKIVKSMVIDTIESFKMLVNWVKTSDSVFAVLIRGSLSTLTKSFEFLKEVLSSVGTVFSDIWGWIKRMTSSALDPILKLLNAFDSFAKDEITASLKEESATPLVNPKAAQQDALNQTITENQKGQLDINVNGNENTETASKNIPASVRISETLLGGV